MDKQHVAVLMGGMSSEHEISLISGRKVTYALDREKYDTTAVTILKTGEWMFPGVPTMSIYEGILELKRRGVQCVFLALHGPYGEDGRVQGLLDLLGLPYTCSGCAASAIAMDKIRSKSLMRQAGVHVARDVVVTSTQWQTARDAIFAQVEKEVGYPCVVKPSGQGSSVGMAIVEDADGLAASIPGAAGYDGCVMLEQFIAGTEVTCGVLDTDSAAGPRALPVTEIRPLTASFFDYHAKYTPGASTEITPAEISDAATAQVQAMAVRAHKVIGCSIWSRSDFLIGPDGPVWLEVNTIPGLTPTSLFPQAAAAVGITFPELCNMFVEAALNRSRR